MGKNKIKTHSDVNNTVFFISAQSHFSVFLNLHVIYT